MKNYNSILILAIVASICAPHSLLRAGEAPPCRYSAEAGRIILYAAKPVGISGTIISHCCGNDGIYYLVTKPEGPANSACIGFILSQTGEISYEKKLPLNLDEYTVRKFMAAEGIAYLLVEPRLPAGSGKILKRINLNSMDVYQLQDVLDFHVEGGDLVLLSKNISGVSLIHNETSVPITLGGEGVLRISMIMDKRMVFVSNGDETEVVDIQTARNLYRYANSRVYLMPDEYNLVIQAEDTRVSEQDDREMVFYKVFIDGLESGRTDSGPARLAREFRIKVDVNKYHRVKLERWVLNASKGRYDRENNIRQPKTENLYIPMNRIVKEVIKFDGKNYIYVTVPVYKQ